MKLESELVGKKASSLVRPPSQPFDETHARVADELIVRAVALQTEVASRCKD